MKRFEDVYKREKYVTVTEMFDYISIKVVPFQSKNNRLYSGILSYVIGQRGAVQSAVVGTLTEK